MNEYKKEFKRQQSLIVSAIAFTINKSISSNGYLWGWAGKWLKRYKYKTQFICQTIYNLNSSIIQPKYKDDQYAYIQSALDDEFSKTQEPIYPNLNEVGR